jgi:hypothetical protein
MSPAGLGPENDCAGEAATIVNNRPIISSEKLLRKDYDRKGTIKRKSLVDSLNGLGAKMN